MIEYEAIEQSLINTISLNVGQRLSTLPVIDTPAVIRHRQGGTKPAEHYISFEQLTTTYFGSGSVLSREVEAGSGDTIQRKDKTIIYRVYCFGDDCYRILEELTELLEFPIRRQAITDTGARLLKVNPPTLTPRISADQQKDNAFMDLFINAPSLVEVVQDSISSVEISNNMNDDLITCTQHTGE